MATLVNNARANQHALLASVDAAQLTTLLLAASTWIQGYCSRTFTSTVHAEAHDGGGGRGIFVDELPIITLTSVVIDPHDGTTASTITNLLDEFLHNAETGEIRFHPNADEDYSYFPVGFQNITINYTAGYATIPEDVQEAVCQVAMALYRLGSSAMNPAFDSEKMGDYAYKLRADTNAKGGLLSASTRMTLAAYKTYERE